MKKPILLIAAALMLLPMISHAGSRGVSLAFMDATASNNTKEGKRLTELLVMDMKKLYAGKLIGELFPWSENHVDLKVLPRGAGGVSFDRLLNTKNSKSIPKLLEKSKVWDGLVVFYYDRANGVVRLKLYDSDGSELMLVRLPLEGKNSAMKHSLMKWHRRGALTAIGSNVRWSP